MGRPSGIYWSTEPSRKQLAWFLFSRVLVITLFLGGTIIYQLRGGENSQPPSIPFLYLLAGLSYLQALGPAALLPKARRLKVFTQAQIVSDLLFSSAVVYFTGGAASPFSFLFILVIIGGGIFLSHREVLFVASASAILYGSLLDLQFYGYLPLIGGIAPPEAIDGRDVFYAVFLNVLAFIFTGILCGVLADRIRKSEAALEKKEIDYGELEELNRTILANIGSGLMIIDVEGKIRSFNTAASKITGYSLEEIYNRDVREIFPAIRIIKEGELFPVSREECRFIGPLRKVQTIGYASSLVKDTLDQTIGMLITFQDLTNLKAMEEQLKWADRLAAVGQMASGMAHEIRNPLASISGSVQLLMEGDHVTPEDRQLMGIVVKEADRLNALLTDFLIFARPKPAKLTEVDASALLNELADMVTADSRFSSIQIRREYPPGVMMQMDRQQFRQALWNLIINGAEAMKAGGVLRLGMDPEQAAVFVEDTGPGIPEDVREKIFDPFFTTKEQGTGLGLATVYSIVEAHHGSIEVSGGGSGGARFTVRLEGKSFKAEKTEF